MSESTEIAVLDQDFALPDQQQTRAVLQQVQQFQSLIQTSLEKDHDFGVIPGTQKPTLLKPGAEKIAKLLGLADTYEIMEQTMEWDRGLFQYVIRASLVSIKTGQVVAQGVGECNSYESRYRYRWIWERELAVYGYATSSGLRERSTRNGGKQYRIENEDPADQINTVLKMAKKRSLVDAALSVGSLSNLFTQDMEEPPRPSQTPQNAPTSPPTPAPPPASNGHQGANGAQYRRAVAWRNRIADTTDPMVATMSREQLDKILDHMGLSADQVQAILGSPSINDWQAQAPEQRTNHATAQHIVGAVIAKGESNGNG